MVPRAGLARGLSLDLRTRVLAAVAEGASLWATIGQMVGTFMPDECANYFAAAGYDPD